MAAVPTADAMAEISPARRASEWSEWPVPVIESSLEARYVPQEMLSDGPFSRVLVVEHRTTRERCAAKVISLKRMSPSLALEASRAAIMAEASMLAHVDHAHVVRLLELLVSDTEVVLVMELVPGGELFEHVVERGRFSERAARRVVAQLASALAHLHELNIVHRDVKPENIFVAQHDARALDVKLGSFGFATYADALDGVVGLAGTLDYVAPEVLTWHDASREEGVTPAARGVPYGPSVDMWSLGVVAFVLLSGYPPFYADSEAALLARVRAARFEFASPYWDEVSAEAIDFISRCLALQPSQRLTAHEASSHPWLSGARAEVGAAARGARAEMRAGSKDGAAAGEVWAALPHEASQLSDATQDEDAYDAYDDEAASAGTADLPAARDYPRAAPPPAQRHSEGRRQLPAAERQREPRARARQEVPRRKAWGDEQPEGLGDERRPSRAQSRAVRAGLQLEAQPPDVAAAHGGARGAGGNRRLERTPPQQRPRAHRDEPPSPELHDHDSVEDVHRPSREPPRSHADEWSWRQPASAPPAAMAAAAHAAPPPVYVHAPPPGMPVMMPPPPFGAAAMLGAPYPMLSGGMAPHHHALLRASLPPTGGPPAPWPPPPLAQPPLLHAPAWLPPSAPPAKPSSREASAATTERHSLESLLGQAKQLRSECDTVLVGAGQGQPAPAPSLPRAAFEVQMGRHGPPGAPSTERSGTGATTTFGPPKRIVELRTEGAHVVRLPAHMYDEITSLCDRVHTCLVLPEASVHPQSAQIATRFSPLLEQLANEAASHALRAATDRGA